MHCHGPFSERHFITGSTHVLAYALCIESRALMRSKGTSYGCGFNAIIDRLFQLSSGKSFSTSRVHEGYSMLGSSEPPWRHVAGS